MNWKNSFISGLIGFSLAINNLFLGCSPPTKHTEVFLQKPATLAPQNIHESQHFEMIRNMEETLFHRINDVRRIHQLKNLKENPLLSKIARRYSQRMCRENFFSHYDPSGQTVVDRVRSEGLSFISLGENIAKNYNVYDPSFIALQSWINSEGHRANILSEEYSETGIGIWKQENQFFFTQIFMKP